MSSDEPVRNECDVAILGGGPAGLSAALILGRQQRSTVVFDSGRYRNDPASESHMYLGSDGAAPAEIRRRGRAELDRHPNVTVQQVTVGEINRVADTNLFEIAHSGGSTVARAVILAAGQLDRPSDIPGVAERFGDAIVHCPFCHGYETLGKKIAVLSEQPTSSEQPAMLALYVRAHFSDNVVLCANGDEIPDKIRDALVRNQITIVDQRISAVSGARDALVFEIDGAAPVHVDVGYHVPTCGLDDQMIDGLGCENDGSGVLVDFGYRTSVPGVYAAGDIARIRGQDIPLPFISQAVAAGQAAALWCDQDLFAMDSGLNS